MDAVLQTLKVNPHHSCVATTLTRADFVSTDALLRVQATTLATATKEKSYVNSDLETVLSETISARVTNSSPKP